LQAKPIDISQRLARRRKRFWPVVRKRRPMPVKRRKDSQGKRKSKWEGEDYDSNALKYAKDLSKSKHQSLIE
jgi:hypothetical protein